VFEGFALVLLSNHCRRKPS